MQRGSGPRNEGFNVCNHRDSSATSGGHEAAAITLRISRIFGKVCYSDLRWMLDLLRARKTMAKRRKSEKWTCEGLLGAYNGRA